MTVAPGAKDGAWASTALSLNGGVDLYQPNPWHNWCKIASGTKHAPIPSPRSA